MIALYLAILPVLLLIAYVYKQDRVEKEPGGLLIKCFLLGAVMIIPAMIIEVIIGVVIDENTMPFLSNFVGVALVEEACKMFILDKVIWKNKEFNYRFDGIVYAVMVSLGFACFENILYVWEGGLSVAILRALTAIPGHTVFAVFMGYYMGEAKLQEVLGNVKGRKRHRRMMLLIPMLIHGFYDYTASSGSDMMVLVFFGFVIVMDVLAFRRIKKSSKEDIPLFQQTEYDSYM